jgi:hypothetical protein
MSAKKPRKVKERQKREMRGRMNETVGGQDGQADEQSGEGNTSGQD